MQSKICPICYILLIVSVYCLPALEAQNLANNYQPFRNYRPSKSQINLIVKKYDSVQLNYKTAPKKQYDVISSSFKNMGKQVVMLDSSNSLMSNDEITLYLNKLKDRIINANRQIITGNFVVFTERSIVPNAYNYGVHVVVFELDLLARMNSEEEVIYVMCHEIAHDLLSHVETGIKKYAELINDETLNKQIKQIKKQEYGAYRKIQQLQTSIVSNYMVHSRENELAADSLGFLLYKNVSPYHNHCLSLLKLLDSVDAPLYDKTVDYHPHFDFNGYQLNESLFIDQDYTDLGGNVKNAFSMPDSLKTHPSCKERIAHIEKLIDKSKFGYSNNTAFQKIQELARFEEIEYLLSKKQFGLAMYYCLHMAQHYPENIYLKNSILYCLTAMYDAASSYSFSSVTELPNYTFYPAEYNKYLIFINNLNTSMLKSMVINYRDKIKFNADKDAYSNFISIYLNKTLDQSFDVISAIEKYISTYNDSHYYQILKSKYPVNKK